MRRFFVGLCFTLLQLFVNAQSNIDVLHYKFSIDLNDNNDTIYGKADILGIRLQPGNEISFDLVQAMPGQKGMKVSNVSGEGSSFKQQNNKLIISFQYPALVNDSFRVKIDYYGVPSDGLIISKNKYGDRTFFADNWPDRAHNWIPCVDDPADKASFEFWVTAPSGYKVISNGVLTEEIITGENKLLTIWKEDVPLSTKVMVIGVAKFAIKTFADSPVGLPVSAWVYPQDSIKGFRNYSVAPAIVKFLSDYIGPFPYKKLANVQSTTRFGGMENASAIFYNEESASTNRSVEDLLTHEIAHQWFGDMATEKSFAHLWLSEGFATYFTDLYLESKYGTDSLNKRMQNEREEVIDFVKTSRKPVVDSVSPYMQLLNPNSYQKGGWVLHMLRRQLGDPVFHQSIRTYYDMYKGKNATTEDLRAVFEKISGKNLDTFFRQWLYTAGMPKLNITWKNISKNKKVAITIEQLQETPFQFPLEILLITGLRNNAEEKLLITKKTETFYFPLKRPMLRLDIDFRTSLLYEGTVNELK